MNKNKIRKLARRVHLQVDDIDLDYFEKSFSVVLPMINDLLGEKIADNTCTMERIISIPLKILELNKVQHQLDVDILSLEEIKKNSFLKNSKIVVARKHE